MRNKTCGLASPEPFSPERAVRPTGVCAAMPLCRSRRYSPQYFNSKARSSTAASGRHYTPCHDQSELRKEGGLPTGRLIQGLRQLARRQHRHVRRLYFAGQKLYPQSQQAADSGLISLHFGAFHRDTCRQRINCMYMCVVPTANPGALLVAQGHHRVYVHGSAGGDEGGEEAHGTE